MYLQEKVWKITRMIDFRQSAIGWLPWVIENSGGEYDFLPTTSPVYFCQVNLY